jgi:membrane-associated phospholipid phosphatase
LAAVANGVGLPTATAAILEAQLAAVLDAAPDREDRFAEIIHQHDAEGAISYFLGMLMIDPACHPKTYLLIRVARRVGELVTMVLKGRFKVPRPSQLSPAIVPMIDPPVTPSFPAGHALEARLIAKSLEQAWAQGSGRASRVDLLNYLAHRLGENRIIAGLHYPRDILGGEAVADACYLLLDKPGSSFHKLVDDAKKESEP